MTKRFQTITAAVLALVALSACNFIINKAGGGSSSQGQSITGATSEGTTDPSDPTCAVTGFDLGAVADEDELVAGGDSAALSMTLTGQQGQPLLEACRATFPPTFTVESSPLPDQCALEGGGFSTKVRARLAAPAGTACTVHGRAGSPSVASNPYTFTVRAAS